MLVLTTLVLLAAGVASGFFNRVASGKPDRSSAEAKVPFAPELDSRAPDFMLVTSSGRAIRLSEFRGRPVLINFWASWCGPCRIEMPTIQERYENFEGAGLVVLAINFDESSDVVAAYGQALGLSFPLVLDPGGEIQKLYRIRSYPTSFFIDSNGIIRAQHIGVMTGNQLDDNLARIGME
jgi:thiol-disulfide isomerase/thioredoxin